MGLIFIVSLDFIVISHMMVSQSGRATFTQGLTAESNKRLAAAAQVNRKCATGLLGGVQVQRQEAPSHWPHPHRDGSFDWPSSCGKVMHTRNNQYRTAG